MSKINRRNFLSALGAMSAGLALSQNSAAQTQTGNVNIQLTDEEKTKKLILASRQRLRDLYFPNVELLTHEGKKVRFYDDLIKDKIVTINFMYATCDGICSTISRNLALAQEMLGDMVGKDVFMYSITLKPVQDTVEVLNAHARAMKAKPGWLFLTGKPEDIELIRRRQGFVDPDPKVDKDKTQHTGNVRYGNEPMQYWASCPGLGDPEVIVESLLWLDDSLREKYLARKERKKYSSGQGTKKGGGK